MRAAIIFTATIATAAVIARGEDAFEAGNVGALPPISATLAAFLGTPESEGGAGMTDAELAWLSARTSGHTGGGGSDQQLVDIAMPAGGDVGGGFGAGATAHAAADDEDFSLPERDGVGANSWVHSTAPNLAVPMDPALSDASLNNNNLGAMVAALTTPLFQPDSADSEAAEPPPNSVFAGPAGAFATHIGNFFDNDDDTMLSSDGARCCCVEKSVCSCWAGGLAGSCGACGGCSTDNFFKKMKPHMLKLNADGSFSVPGVIPVVVVEKEEEEEKGDESFFGNLYHKHRFAVMGVIGGLGAFAVVGAAFVVTRRCGRKVPGDGYGADADATGATLAYGNGPEGRAGGRVRGRKKKKKNKKSSMVPIPEEPVAMPGVPSAPPLVKALAYV